MARGLVGALTLLAAFATSLPDAACAWGDRGHMVVGLIAERHLEPVARERVQALLDADTDTLTPPDLAARATWADRWRDSDRHGARIRYRATRDWHFVNVPIDAPDPAAALDAACQGHPPLPPGTLASEGPARACILDKVEQFAAALARPDLPQAERLLALKFLLHFVGDLHQPLHAGDHRDRGGNEVMVLAEGSAAAQRLHAYWDTTVVRRLGREAGPIAETLAVEFEPRRAEWSAGRPRDWVLDSVAVSRRAAYPVPEAIETDEVGRPAHRLGEVYEAAAVAAAREQLAKAGFRLAALLNAALR